MIKIAISHRVYEDLNKREHRDCLDQRWVYLADVLDGLLYPVPTQTKDINLWLNTLRPDFIILSGGNSLEKHNDNDIAPEKDKSEIKILDWATKNDIPTLGVCRGAQLINQYFGGNDIKPVGHSQRHFIRHNGQFDDNVNSSHSYCILKNILNNNSEILATAHNVVEAFKITDKKIWAIMWHPEREITFTEKDICFIKSIIGQ